MASKKLSRIQKAEHGQLIYVYNHLRTKQVVYSLTRALNNTKALKQIPFTGKKTKPAALRKDFWRPLATVSFPSSYQGLEAFKQLREFKKRHEHEWDPSEFSSRSKKVIGKELQNQKANSIADLAAVLQLQEKTAKEHAQDFESERELTREALQKAEARIDELRGLRTRARDAVLNAGSEEEHAEALKQYKLIKAEKLKIQRRMKKPVPHKALAEEWDPLNDGSPQPKRGPRRRLELLKDRPRWTMDGIAVQWKDIFDLEFAKEWPQPVKHSQMPRTRGVYRNTAPPITPPKPQPSELDERMRLLKDPESVKKTATDLSLPESASKEEPTRLRRIIDRLQHGSR